MHLKTSAREKSNGSMSISKKKLSGGARGVMVIVAGNGHGDTSSNPGWDWLHLT